MQIYNLVGVKKYFSGEFSVLKIVNNASCIRVRMCLAVVAGQLDDERWLALLLFDGLSKGSTSRLAISRIGLGK